MRFKDLKRIQQHKFKSIIENLVRSQGQTPEKTIDAILDFFSDFYNIEKIKIVFKRNSEMFTQGWYDFSTNQINIANRYNSSKKLANIFGILAHELTHVHDYQHYVTNPLINHKTNSSLVSSSIGGIKGFLTSKYILALPNFLYSQHFYGSHPAERYARRQAFKFTKLLLKETKTYYKIYKHDFKDNVKIGKIIFQIHRELFKQAYLSLNWALAPIFYPIAKPCASFTYHQLGKKLYRQIKNDKMDKDWDQNFFKWTKTFGIKHFQSKRSKQKLIKIYELANKNKDLGFAGFVSSQMQVLGFIDDTPEAVEENIQNILTSDQNVSLNVIKKQICTYYYNYNHEFIAATTEKLYKHLNSSTPAKEKFTQKSHKFSQVKNISAKQKNNEHEIELEPG